MAEKNEQEKLKELIGENNQKGSHWWDEDPTLILITTWVLMCVGIVFLFLELFHRLLQYTGGTFIVILIGVFSQVATLVGFLLLYPSYFNTTLIQSIIGLLLVLFYEYIVWWSLGKKKQERSLIIWTFIPFSGLVLFFFRDKTLDP